MSAQQPLRELIKPQKHKLKAAVKQRFGGACAFCGCVPRFLTLDHIVARSKGGLDVKSNLAPVCQRCNRSKGSRPLWEWWEPEEASFYGNELVISSSQRWTRAQKLELLLWHPLFTGLCPQCRYPFPPDSEHVHWDCPSCGWKDDTV